MEPHHLHMHGTPLLNTNLQPPQVRSSSFLLKAHCRALTQWGIRVAHLVQYECSTDAWSAYGVDAWFNAWNRNRSSLFSSKNSMIKAFQEEFNPGTDHTCIIDAQCNYIDNCFDLPNHGNDTDSAQIYLVWIALPKPKRSVF